MIRDEISKSEGYDIGTKMKDNTELTYGQFFKLIKNLGSFTDSCTNVISNSAINKKALFSEDGISSVDINASGLVAETRARFSALM